MSSTLLYLAIVAVWAIVLVPMWLHRDTDTTTGFSRLLHRRPDAPPTEAPDASFDDPAAHADPADPADLADDDDPTPAQPPSHHHRNRRAAIIARRRRRTTGLLLLTLASPLAPVLGLTPWYVTIPPVLLLTAHLALLRTATKIDAQRATQARQARHLQSQAEAEATLHLPEAPTPDATLLNFPPRTALFDQYAEDPPATPRAVND